MEKNGDAYAYAYLRARDKAFDRALECEAKGNHSLAEKWFGLALKHDQRVQEIRATTIENDDE